MRLSNIVNNNPKAKKIKDIVMELECSVCKNKYKNCICGIKRLPEIIKKIKEVEKTI